MERRRLHAADALLPTGWARDVLLEWDADGTFVAVTPDGPRPEGVAAANGPVLPGMPNLHSHAFQRAFAGLTEFRGAGADSFWSWRDLMYRVANRITPDALDAIATWLYVEMLEAGYTSVCEFHYLHNDVDGRPYADAATLARVLLHAADGVGLGMTMLPVLYQQGGFGGVTPADGQRRFLKTTSSLLALIDTLRAAAPTDARVGLALHSLRAVTPAALLEVVDGITAVDAAAPIHIHVAEQQREVDDCLAWSGQRPVEWLLDHAPVDGRWCLVHATHMTAAEARRAAATGAVAGLCPTTEANLGDGIFDLPRWVGSGGPPVGRWGIGSDSHVTVDPAEELRLLEYSQRLATERRNVGVSADHAQAGTALMLAAVAGAAAASGRPIAGLAQGQRADFVVLDRTHPLIAGLPAPAALDVHVFASSRGSAIDGVHVGASWPVRNGRHRLRTAAAQAFVSARSALAIRG